MAITGRGRRLHYLKIKCRIGKESSLTEHYYKVNGEEDQVDQVDFAGKYGRRHCTGLRRRALNKTCQRR